jgi:integrase
MRRKLQQDKRNGNYYIWIQQAGVSKYFQFGTNKRTAEQELAALEIRIAKGEVAFAEQSTLTVLTNGKKDMRVEVLAVKHLEWIQNNRAAGTFNNRQYFIKLFMEFLGRPAMVSEITRVKLEEFYAWARQHHGRGENGGNELFAHIKAMLRWGEEMELVDLNFKRFPPMNHTPPETKRISEDVLRLLFEKKPESEEPDDFRDLLRFGLLTGLRPQELRTLSKDNIRENSTGATFLLIERHKTSRTANEPKPRTVPLSPPAKEVLQRQLASHPKSDYVFLNAEGTPYTRYSLKTRLKRLCQRLGIKVFSPYALRHTFASMQSDGNIETTSLSRLMGHSSTRTVQRYISNTFTHYQDAVNTLAEHVEGIIQSGNAGEKKGMNDAKVGQKLPPELPPRKRGL